MRPPEICEAVQDRDGDWRCAKCKILAPKGHLYAMKEDCAHKAEWKKDEPPANWNKVLEDIYSMMLPVPPIK